MMGRLTWVLGICFLAVVTSAQAQHRAGDVYAGAMLGITWYPQLEEGLEHDIDSAASGMTDLNFSANDDRVFAWSVFAGYALSETVAIEAGYLGNRKVSVTATTAATFDGIRVQSEIDARTSRWSLYGALVGHLPIASSVRPFGKIGARRWHDEFRGAATAVYSGQREAHDLSGDDNGFGLLIGVGADIPVTEAASFRTEYLYLPLDDDHGGDEHRVQIGMHYAF